MGSHISLKARNFQSLLTYSAAARLGVSPSIVEKYYNVVKYLMGRRALEGLEFQTEAMGLDLQYFE
ncbi:MAG: hypothetical protein QXS16_04240 [Pyrobaculum sp.]